MVMKTINNSMVQIYVSGLTELIPLAKKAGLPLKTALDILCTGPAGLPVVRDRIPKILGDDDTVGFTNSGTAKDNDVFRKILHHFDMRSPMLEGFDRQRAFSEKMGLAERDPAEVIRAAYGVSEAI
jgi:3-hydroxyisobutyrate dehydrogenase-like beta-hydroxyacid dehydrogenase